MKVQPIGALRRRLIVEAPVHTGEEAAASSTVWTTFTILWAAVLPRAGREIVAADGVATRVTHEIEMRWRDDLTAAMRLRDGNTIYAIRAIYARDPQRRRLVAQVEELAP